MIWGLRQFSYPAPAGGRNPLPTPAEADFRGCNACIDRHDEAGGARLCGPRKKPITVQCGPKKTGAPRRGPAVNRDRRQFSLGNPWFVGSSRQAAPFERALRRGSLLASKRPVAGWRLPNARLPAIMRRAVATKSANVLGGTQIGNVT